MRFFAIPLLLCCVLAACGQKGDLYLPSAHHHSEPETDHEEAVAPESRDA